MGSWCDYRTERQLRETLDLLQSVADVSCSELYSRPAIQSQLIPQLPIPEDPSGKRIPGRLLRKP